MPRRRDRRPERPDPGAATGEGGREGGLRGAAAAVALRVPGDEGPTHFRKPYPLCVLLLPPFLLYISFILYYSPIIYRKTIFLHIFSLKCRNQWNFKIKQLVSTSSISITSEKFPGLEFI